MPDSVSDLARRLAEQAEAICRHYLSNGHRQGRYWLVGDVHNQPGRSLYVRLHGPFSGKGAAGKWADAATGEHGDLLDLIAAARGHQRLGETLDEARRFLGLATTRRNPGVPSGPPSPSNHWATTAPWSQPTPFCGPSSLTAAGSDRGRAAPVRPMPPDRRHPRRDLPAGSRHHARRRLPDAALSPPLPLPAGPR